MTSGYFFKTFANRLEAFMEVSDMVIVTSGGVGTLLELAYTWQLIQVGHLRKIPIVLVPTSYCNIQFQDLIKGGANIIIYANHMLRAAYPGMSRVAESILKEGCSSIVEKDMLSIREILKISGGI